MTCEVAGFYSAFYQKNKEKRITLNRFIIKSLSIFLLVGLCEVCTLVRLPCIKLDRVNLHL